MACQAQTKPRPNKSPTVPAKPNSRPQPIPKASVAPTIIVTPSKKPLAPAQLEEALRLFLNADSTRAVTPRTGMEAQGLVLDQAISKLGHDFYDFFYNIFEAPATAADYSVVVSERPARGNTSLIVVTVNETELLELPLPNRADQLQEVATYAAETAQQYLLETQNISKQLESGHTQPVEVF